MTRPNRNGTVLTAVATAGLAAQLYAYFALAAAERQIVGIIGSLVVLTLLVAIAGYLTPVGHRGKGPRR